MLAMRRIFLLAGLFAGLVVLSVGGVCGPSAAGSNKQFTEVAKYRVSDSDTWCVPIVAGNRVYVKDKGGSLALWTLE